jgi:hypothetical protein
MGVSVGLLPLGGGVIAGGRIINYLSADVMHFVQRHESIASVAAPSGPRAYSTNNPKAIKMTPIAPNSPNAMRSERPAYNPYSDLSVGLTNLGDVLRMRLGSRRLCNPLIPLPWGSILQNVLASFWFRHADPRIEWLQNKGADDRSQYADKHHTGEDVCGD